MPISLSIAQTFASLLQNDATLASGISALAQADGLIIPQITPSQVLVSSASVEFGDDNLELSYPRVCVYVTQIRNTLMERFRAFSGTALAVADIWASAPLITQCDLWIHYYLEAVTGILEESRGDWGNGVYFSGVYEAQIQPPKVGGLGFVQSAKLICTINVSSD